MLANFDGIVGPTHNYAGLSYGNVASDRSRGSVSHPRAAALQGLAKMKFLADLGVPQGVLPPHERPHVPSLRRLGYRGTDARIVEQAYADDPVLFASFCSASAMWTANAATVSAAAGTADGRVHLTPANLVAKLHRAIEPPTTTAILRATFSDPDRFVVHDPLPASEVLGDEGAANHTSLATDYAAPPLEIFVYGRVATDGTRPRPTRFPARQTLEASRAVARLHGLDPARCVFVQQNPAAIDAGVFHNDVIAVGDLGTLLHHELAYVEAQPMLARCRDHLGDAFNPVCVPADRVSLHDAVTSYLFNSQLLRVDGELHLVAPTECRDTPAVAAYVAELVEAGTLDQVHFLDVRESMRNGGGPACLRLRVPLGPAGLAGINPGSLLDDALYTRLVAWVDRHYRDDLVPADLADPHVLDESRTALDELTALLGLGPLYEFQRP